MHLFQAICKFKNITTLDIIVQTQLYAKHFKIREKASGSEPVKLPKTLRNLILVRTGIEDFTFLYSLTELTYLELYEDYLSDQILSIITTSCTKLEGLTLGNDDGKFLFFIDIDI